MTREHILVSAQELHRRLGDADLRIVDCRFDLMRPEKGHDDYLAGHVPGAVYANLDRDLAGPVSAGTGRHPLPPPGVFAATLAAWGIADDTDVVVYDDGGAAIAARLWWLLHWIGHERVGVLDGGFAAWQRAGLPVSAEVPRLLPRVHSARPDAGQVIATGELQAALAGDRPPLLLDARAAARFRGEVEPIDTAAGHVPGARNLPFDRSLRGDGTWRDRGDLEALWREALSGAPGGPWIAMCGSGVTACHLALSARLAGVAAPRLYAGSFSEWIRDPSRPVATGPAEGPAGEG